MVDLTEGPWKVPERQSLHFRAMIGGEEHLCAITSLALVDDYHQPGNKDWIEIFEENLEDILRRAQVCLPENPAILDGEPTVIFRQGDAMG